MRTKHFLSAFLSNEFEPATGTRAHLKHFVMTVKDRVLVTQIAKEVSNVAMPNTTRDTILAMTDFRRFVYGLRLRLTQWTANAVERPRLCATT